MTELVFPEWREQYTANWGMEPLRIPHVLHQSPLFSMDSLADLIEKYPRDLCTLNYMGPDRQSKAWLECDTTGSTGAEIIDAIANGQLWLNLRSTETVDQRYATLLEKMYTEIRGHVPAHEPYAFPSCGILISSPGCGAPFHLDLPNQALLQVVGRKRLYIYPGKPPFMKPEDIERISIYVVEVDMHYEPEFEQHAVVIEMEPGDMIHWPLNAPHRVVNHDCLNVSFTSEYWSAECLRRHRLNMANGTLRHYLGITPRSRATEGAAFWMKAMMHSAVSRTGWLERARTEKRSVTLRLDKERPGQVLSL